MEPRVPARIDRATFERVLQRAAELQAASASVGDGMTEEELVALAGEVGIPAQHIRQALVEEHTRALAKTPPSGFLDRLVGSSEVAADRVVQGDAPQIAAAITAWLNQHERFVVQRSAAGHLTFEPMDAIAGTLRRVGAMFDPHSAKPYLGKAQLITASITPLDAGCCHVALRAMISHNRAGHVAGGATMGAGGILAGAVLVVAGASAAIAVVPVAVFAAGGFAIARLFRQTQHRVEVGLERLLDELERNPPLTRPSPGDGTGSIARGVGKVVREIGDEVRRNLRP